MDWSNVGEALLGQLGALLTFFAFPALQYIFLRRLARREGQPELWYLPRYGFRLVIRNLPRRTLSNIQYQAIRRTVVPASDGASVATYQDEVLIKREDLFVFPGVDQVLLCFALMADDDNCLNLLHTDKLGNELRRFRVDDRDVIVADFMANVENLWNFDVTVARSIEISGNRLHEIATELRTADQERQFAVSRVRDVG